MAAKRYINAIDLAGRWEMGFLDIKVQILESGLPVYKMDRSLNVTPLDTPEEIQGALKAARRLNGIRLLRADVDAYEKMHPEFLPDQQQQDKPAAAKHAELSFYALLKQPNFKKTMAAMKDAFQFCEERGKVTRAELKGYLQKRHGIPNNLIREIRKAIPNTKKYMKGVGPDSSDKII